MPSCRQQCVELASRTVTRCATNGGSRDRCASLGRSVGQRCFAACTDDEEPNDDSDACDSTCGEEARALYTERLETGRQQTSCEQTARRLSGIALANAQQSFGERPANQENNAAPQRPIRDSAGNASEPRR